MGKKVIEIKNIRKDFGKRTVLKDVNFDVHEKEVVSIIGSSGSGKSTLLRCINAYKRTSFNPWKRCDGRRYIACNIA